MQSAGEGQMAVNALQVRAEMTSHTLHGGHANTTSAASFELLQQTCPVPSNRAICSTLQQLAALCSSL